MDPYAAIAKPVTSYDTISKPVAKTAAPKPKATPKVSDNVLMDVLKAARSGTIKGFATQADQLAQSAPQALAGNMINTGLGMANDLQSLLSTVRGKDIKPQKSRDMSKNLRMTPDLTEQSGKTIGGYHKPATVAGRYADTIAQFLPTAFLPGSLPAKAANVILPGVAAETAALGAQGMGLDERGQDIARMGGAIVGGGLTSVRRPAVNSMKRDPVLERLAKTQSPDDMARKAAEFKAAGVQPTLADLLDDSAHGLVRAAATRQKPARQKALNYREKVALDLPSRISTQAKAMSSDPRTPDQIRAAMAKQRSANADVAFSAVRNQPIPIAEESVAALRSDYGRKAISEAAARERDPEIKAALNRLHNDAFDNPGQTVITVGMADRVSRVLNGQASKAARAGDNELASILGDHARSIRNPAKAASEGYQSALQGYAADTKLQEAAGVGESLLKPNTDEFVAQAKDLGPDERALALAAGRRAIERSVGENPAAAPGVARRFVNSAEQQQRTSALFGPERAQDAEKLQNAMRLEELRLQNANAINPRGGSNTSLNAQDASNLASGIETGKKVIGAATGNWKDAIGLTVDWLRSRGIDDSEAQRLVELSISKDPAEIAQVQDYISRRLGPEGQRKLLEIRPNVGLIGAITGQAQ